MKNPEVNIIYEPVFFYNGAYAIPTLYNKKTKKISNLKISTSTKRIDLIKQYWDYQVLNKNKIPIDKISYYVLNTKKYKAFELNFYETFKINTSIDSRNDKKAKDIGDYISVRKTKTGNGFKKNGQPYEKFSIFNIVAEYCKFGTKKNPIQFKKIDYYIKKIKESKSIKFANKLTIQDNTPFGKNPHIPIIIEYLYPEFAGYNSKFIKNKDIIEGKSLKDLTSSCLLLQYIYKKKIQVINKSYVQSYVNKIEHSKIIWYDFEGFSLPFPTIDGYNPFQQTPFQVSIIETVKMNKTRTINKIYDPSKFNYMDFPELINLIYAQKADHYVVFNESYENYRMIEMMQILKEMNHPNWLETQKKITWIINHTIDLAKPFAVFTKDSLPAILIPELKGKHSIKLIEKFITKNNYKFKNMIKPYKNLDIKNGNMAMEIAVCRAIGIVGDKEWLEKQDVLKEYCENDVKAMIMIYTLLKTLLKKQIK